MSEELVSQDNLSKELLKTTFDDAFMDASFDEEGDLRVKEQVNCWVFPSEARDRIRLLAIFTFKSGTNTQRRLEFVNAVNKEYIVVRAVAGDNDRLLFTYDILVNGGITKRALVFMVKRFCAIPFAAIGDLGPDIVM